MLVDSSYNATFCVFPVERDHHSHRTFAKSGDNFCGLTSIATRSVVMQVQESKTAADVAIQASPTLHDAHEEPDAAESQLAVLPQEAPRPRYIRKQTANQLHRHKWIEEQLAVNPKFKPISAEGWKAWREAWDALSSQQKAKLEEQSAMTEAMSDGWRSLHKKRPRGSQMLPIADRCTAQVSNLASSIVPAPQEGSLQLARPSLAAHGAHRPSILSNISNGVWLPHAICGDSVEAMGDACRTSVRHDCTLEPSIRRTLTCRHSQKSQQHSVHKHSQIGVSGCLRGLRQVPYIRR